MATSTNELSIISGIKVKELAGLISATVFGNPENTVSGFCSLDEPLKGNLSFTKSNRTIDIQKIVEGKPLAALIVPEGIEGVESLKSETALLVVKDPQHAIVTLTKRFLSMKLPEPGISKLADIHPESKIGKDVHIGAFCSIGKGVEIGDNTVLFPHVVVYEDAIIGSHTVIHSGAVIREKIKIGSFCVVQNGAVVGGDGFGYYLSPEKRLEAVPQVGIVEVKDRVDIGANACIDRATLGKTLISNSVKIDNLVQIGHNTKIGDASIICGQTGVAGSCNIGAGVTLAGAVGVGDHLNIVSGVRVGGKGVVTSHIDEPGDYMGHPVVKAGDWRRVTASLKQLPRLVSDVKSLMKNKN